MRTMNSRVRKTLAIAVGAGLVASMIGVSPAFAEASTVTVCATGCDSTTIAGGIGAAVAGDTVEVGPGTYKEDVNVSKAITLTSAGGAESTTIVATAADKVPLGFGSSVSGAVVNGFTITYDYTDGEIDAWNSINNIAVLFHQGASGNTLSNNIIMNGRNGVYLNTSPGNTITGNTITDNRTGINFTGAVDGTVITNNIISHNLTLGIVGYANNVVRPNLSTFEVSGNTFTDNWYGDILIKPSTANSPTSTPVGILDVTDNVFSNDAPTFTTLDSVELNEPGWANQRPEWLGGDAVPPSDTRSNLRTYGYGDSGPQIKYEDPKTIEVGGFVGYPTIAAGIAAASAGDIVDVAAGTYTGSVALNKAVTLRGAGNGSDPATNTVISGTTGNGIATSNGSADARVQIENLRVTGFTTGVAAASYTTLNGVVSTDNATNGINLTGTVNEGLRVSDSTLSFNKNGLKLGSTASASDIEVTDSHFDDNVNGWYIDKNTTNKRGTYVEGVLVQNTTFDRNSQKGLYTEKLSNALFIDVTANDSGHDRATMGNGISINLKDAEYDDIVFTNLTATNSGGGVSEPHGAAVDISARNDGSYADTPATLTGLVIDGGTIDGVSTTGLIIGGDTQGAVVKNVDFSGNTVALRNENAGQVTATHNFWGSAQPNFKTLISGSVSYSPWYSDAAMTQTATDAVIPDENGNATPTPEAPKVVVTSPSAPITVTVTKNTPNASIDYSALKTTTSTSTTATLPKTVVNTPNGSVTIPAGTVVTGPPAWDGVISAPTILPNTEVTVPTADGFTTDVTAVIEVGADGMNLEFDQAVRLLIPNQGGQKAGFVRGGDFTAITTVCAADNQTSGDALVAGGECAITVGDDLVVWTKHFTTFVAYSVAATPAGGSGGLANTGGQGAMLPAASGLLLLLLGATTVLVARRTKRGTNK